MRLLINAIPLLGEESGIGTYTRQIATAAAAHPADFDLEFFYGYASRKLIQGEDASLLGSLKGIARKTRLLRKIGKKILHLANKGANLIHAREWDCYFEPNFVLLPTLRAKRKIITIHDFSCFRYPQWHPEERVRHMRKSFWQSVARADHIITVSETIRQEACEMFDIPKEKLTAAPNGVDHSLFKPASGEAIASLRQRYGLPASFILYVGAIEPRKNLSNLIMAHASLPAPLKRRFPLLLIGSQGWRNEEIMENIHRQAPYVRILGYAPKTDLPAFYSAAAFFAYPSFYEGFGLPAAEAMACGRATLASLDPALQETCGGAALAADANDVDALAEQMRRLLEDEALRSDLESKALERSKCFSWERSAQIHLNVFKAATCVSSP